MAKRYAIVEGGTVTTIVIQEIAPVNGIELVPFSKQDQDAEKGGTFDGVNFSPAPLTVKETKRADLLSTPNKSVTIQDLIDLGIL